MANYGTPNHGTELLEHHTLGFYSDSYDNFGQSPMEIHKLKVSFPNILLTRISKQNFMSFVYVKQSIKPSKPI